MSLQGLGIGGFKPELKLPDMSQDNMTTNNMVASGQLPQSQMETKPQQMMTPANISPQDKLDMTGMNATPDSTKTSPFSKSLDFGTEIDRKIEDLQKTQQLPEINANMGFGGIGTSFGGISQPKIAPGMDDLAKDDRFKSSLQLEKGFGVTLDEVQDVYELSPYEMEAMKQKKAEGYSREEFMVSVAKRRKEIQSLEEGLGDKLDIIKNDAIEEGIEIGSKEYQDALRQYAGKVEQDDKSVFKKFDEGITHLTDEIAQGVESGGKIIGKAFGDRGEAQNIITEFVKQRDGLSQADAATWMVRNMGEYQQLKQDYKDNPEKYDQFKTNIQQDILEVGEGALATIWAGMPIPTAVITAASTTEGGGFALEKLGAAISRGGKQINKIEFMQDFKDALPTEEEKERFDAFVGLAATMGISKAASELGLGKAAKTKRGELMKKAEIEFKAKITPELTEAIKGKTSPKDNPYVGEYLEEIKQYTDGEMKTVKNDFKDQAVKKVADEQIKPLLDEKIESYREGGELYNELKKQNQKIELEGLEQKAEAIVKEYEPSISVKHETLVNNALKEVKKAVETSKKGEFTTEVALNVRKNLSELADYTETKSIANQAVKEVRKALDTIMKDQIAGLKEIDAFSSKKISEIQEFQKQIINREGNINYNNIKNVTSLSKSELATRLNEYAPGVVERIAAINEAMSLAKSTKGIGLVGRLGTRGGAMAVGGMVGGPVGVFVGGILESMFGGKLNEVIIKKNQNKILKEYENLTPEAQAKAKVIGEKLEANKQLNAAEIELINKTKEKVLKDTDTPFEGKTDINTTKLKEQGLDSLGKQGELPSGTKNISKRTITSPKTKGLEGLQPKEVTVQRVENISGKHGTQKARNKVGEGTYYFEEGSVAKELLGDSKTQKISTTKINTEKLIPMKYTEYRKAVKETFGKISEETMEQFNKTLKDQGYEGIVLEIDNKTGGPKEYVVFNK